MHEIFNLWAFKKGIVKKLVKPKDAFRNAILLVLGSGLASGALALYIDSFVNEDLQLLIAEGISLPILIGIGAVFIMIIALLGRFFSAWIYGVVGGRLGGKQNYKTMFISLAHISPISILAVIPLIGLLFTLYQLSLEVFVISEVQGLSIGKSILTIILSGVAILALAIAFVVVLFMIGFAVGFAGL